jgi:O-antigen/teichoic acid export membrane protein
VFVATIFVLAPAIIPKLDGGKYPESVEVLQIFLVVAFSSYVAAPAASILMAQRRYRVLFGVYALGLLLNFVGDVSVAARFGVVGIAVVSSAVYAAIHLVLIGQALRYQRGRRRKLRPCTRATRRGGPPYHPTSTKR